MANLPTCYYPSGTPSPDTPCHLEDGDSACCARTDICLSNGLCLAQGGSELISRGSCTDGTWQSPKCSQYCSDVNTGGGALIFLAGYIQNQFLFCCSQYDVSNGNNTCATASRGSYSPFPLEAGQVIFNRTSGSTTNSIANAATVTEHATITIHTTATASTIPSSSSPSASLTTSLSCSSQEAAIGAGLGVTLGLALLATLALLWRQRKHRLSLKTDLKTWEWKYNELTTTSKAFTLSGATHQPTMIHQLPAWTPSELDGRLPPSEMADKPRGA